MPIVVVLVVESDDQPLVQQVLQAQEYWRLKGLASDVVILNEHAEGYRSEMHAHLESLVQSGPWARWRDRPGGVYLLRSEPRSGRPHAPPRERPRASSTASAARLAEPARPSLSRAALAGARTAATRVGAIVRGITEIGRDLAACDRRPPGPHFAPPSLHFENGLGGFASDGREYVIALAGDAEPPRPWSNVLANPDFGSLVTARGPGLHLVGEQP